MRRLFQYLKQEGLKTTFEKIWSKVFHHTKSHTVFLRTRNADKTNMDNYDFEMLTNDNLNEFEKIKFWDFVNASDYINNPHRSIILLKKEMEYIGYAAETHETKRIIHGLGSFLLQGQEGWIGPVYVKKQYRGHGFNRIMLAKQIQRLRSKNITSFFTSINSLNSASLISFKRAGFEEIGVVNTQGDIVKDSEYVLSNAFRKN